MADIWVKSETECPFCKAPQVNLNQCSGGYSCEECQHWWGSFKREPWEDGRISAQGGKKEIVH